MIDTASVANRRRLEFASADDALRDAERLVAAEESGRLERLGNWTLGQALGHLAAWASYPYEGYPMEPPWLVRLLGRMLKSQLLRRPLPAGFRIRGAPEGTYGTQEMPAREGLRRVEKALRRLERTPPTAPNPVFGPLSPQEWLRLNLGHAALHQGFFRVRGDDDRS